MKGKIENIQCRNYKAIIFVIIQNLNGINTLLIEYKTELEELQLFSSL